MTRWWEGPGDWMSPEEVNKRRIWNDGYEVGMNEHSVDRVIELEREVRECRDKILDMMSELQGR